MPFPRDPRSGRSLRSQAPLETCPLGGLRRPQRLPLCLIPDLEASLGRLFPFAARIPRSLPSGADTWNLSLKPALGSFPSGAWCLSPGALVLGHGPPGRPGAWVAGGCGHSAFSWIIPVRTW